MNACDNFQRCPDKMNYIKVDLPLDLKEWNTSFKEDGSQGTQTKCEIVVENNGETIAVEHKDQGKLFQGPLPEMVFSHLLTGDNYDDSQERVTGGRNGYGSKLTNIFSTKFSVTCNDTRIGKKFHQVWTDNLNREAGR